MRGKHPVWFLSVQGSPSPHSLNTPKTHLLRDTGENCEFLAIYSQAAWVSWADRRAGMWVTQFPATQGCPCSRQRWEMRVALAVLGPAGKGGEDGVGCTPKSQSGPCRQPSPTGTTFSQTSRGLRLPPGRLQEQGPDSAMLRTSSTAELSNCPLSAQDQSEQGALPQSGPRLPPASRPQYLTAGLHLSFQCYSLPTPSPDILCSTRGTLVTLSQEGWFGEWGIYQAQGTIAPPPMSRRCIHPATWARYPHS